MLLLVGVWTTLGFALWLAWLTLRGPAGAAVAPFPAYGWWGLAAMAGLELLLALGAPGVSTFFTALIWTAYIVASDAAVFHRRGDSLLCHPAAFTALAALSIPGWLIFEAYNLRLRNWAYVAVPSHFWGLALGAGWAFATIYPGVFETADLIHSAFAADLRCHPWRAGLRLPLVALGAGCLAAPLLVPAAWAPYAFAPVWAGFVFLLDPLCHAWGWPSLLADLELGRPGRGAALLLSGAACGFFWEFWNYWARARWEYVFPILPRYRIFAMPVPGFLGFPPFALECFTVYIFLSHFLLPPRLRAPLLSSPRRGGMVG